jgi:GT2 family glycosyltransferase
MTALCIPTLNNLNGVLDLIESAEKGSVVPDRYLVMDNGGIIDFELPRVETFHPKYNLGVAKSWNEFIKSTTNQRVISNDDLILGKFTFEKLISAPYDVVSIEGLNAYSLFNVRDSAIDLIGYFDEKISPDYGYFEDNDFDWRLKLAGGNRIEIQDLDYKHIGSVTMSKLTGNDLEAHHRKFRRAREYYRLKWGGDPSMERYRTAFDGAQEIIATRSMKEWWKY